MAYIIHIALGSFILSLIHAAIPNHWLPIVLLCKTNKWSLLQSLAITTIVGLAHTLSTVIIGILIGLIGYQLSTNFEFLIKIVAPLILIGLGSYYIVKDLFHHYHHLHHHHYHHHIDISNNAKNPEKLTIAIIISLSIAMFFSPCLEIEAYYLTASIKGVLGIIVISIIYVLVTVLGMVTLVFLGIKGVERIQSKFLEEHEAKIIGTILIILGIITYLGIFE